MDEYLSASFLPISMPAHGPACRLITVRRLWWSAACADTPHVPASDEVAELRARVAELEELTARLRQAAAAPRAGRRPAGRRDAQIAALAAQAEELRRRG